MYDFMIRSLWGKYKKNGNGGGVQRQLYYNFGNLRIKYDVPGTNFPPGMIFILFQWIKPQQSEEMGTLFFKLQESGMEFRQIFLLFL